jgi:glycerophosphoryl diester phosphodiesterase
MTFDLANAYAIPDNVVVTAHRGFSGLYPENTLDAFVAAVDLGVDILEFDIRGTRDAVPIVLHDRTFERTANQPAAPHDYDLAEVKTFEASYWSGAHNDGVKLDAPAVPGARVPTFEEVLEAVGSAVGLNIQVYDTSAPILDEVCRLYRARDLYTRGYLTLSTMEEAERVRAIDPAVELCVTERQGRMDLDVLRRLAAFGCHYVQPLRRDVTPAFCQAAREIGLYANMFFANTEADNRTYIEMGMQGILTDRPDILLATLRALGRR